MAQAFKWHRFSTCVSSRFALASGQEFVEAETAGEWLVVKKLPPVEIMVVPSFTPPLASPAGRGFGRPRTLRRFGREG